MVGDLEAQHCHAQRIYFNFSRWFLSHGYRYSTKICFLTVSFVCFCASTGLFTLTGVSIYIRYSNQAMEEFQRVVPPENLAYVDVSFGWSLATAWLSYSLEVATGLLLMLAASDAFTQMRGHYDSGVTISML